MASARISRSILRRLVQRGDSAASSRPAHTTPVTDDDIAYCYRVFLHRDPDPDGLAHYGGRARAGATFGELVENFVHSDEFRMRVGVSPQHDIAEVDLGGYRVAVHRLDPDFGNHIFSFHEYEEHVRSALRAHVREGDVFVDIGANVGVMTLLAATIVGTRGHVVAVEPNPANLQMLYRGMMLNRMTNVEVLPYAASNARGLFTLGGLSNAHLMDPGSPNAGADLAQSVVLDDLLGDMPRLDCVKIDVEGHEPAATQGFWRNLTRHRPALLVEFNPLTLARAGEDMIGYAELLLSIYPSLRATSAFGDDAVFDRADALVEYLHGRDREISAAGKLPAGVLHLDLVAERVPPG
jgi:FkbM family methyltransferase